MHGGCACRSVVVVLDGLSLHCLVAGAGSPVVLVHGLVGSAQNWDLNIPALAERHSVYALDLPFMGSSIREPGDVALDLDAALEASADRLARWAHALGIERAHWAGSSHGGAQVLMLAARHPEMVQSAVLFAPANPFCSQATALIRFYNSWPGNRLSRLIPWVPRFIQHWAHARVYGDKSKVRQASLESYTCSLNPAGVRHTLAILQTWWTDMELLRRSLPQCTNIPALLVWGSRDGVVGVDSGRTFAAALGAELTVIDGPGHLAFTEEAEQANRLMLDWFERHRS
jgi:4,5:9,10-diseco-3-hydroxy-5,9,17-trioxoandrosta-1(10),2-diene-4-oate hydrolase